MSSYFEIAGHVVEQRYRQEFGSRPSANPVIDYAKQRGVPAPLAKRALKEASKDLGYDLVKGSEGIGHGKRAMWAFTTAAGLAAADGPLPIGDVLAGGVLIWYGYHESKRAYQKIMQ